jgi:hypothetical protein
MAAFGIIALQFALEVSDNLSATADEASPGRRRYLRARMVVLPELAASGPGICSADARGAGRELVHLAGGVREVIAPIGFEYIRRWRERGWQGLGRVLKSFRDGPTRFSAYDRAPVEHAALSSLARAQRGLPMQHPAMRHGEN